MINQYQTNRKCYSAFTPCDQIWQHTRSCFECESGNSFIAPMATGRASLESLKVDRNLEAAAGPPPLSGSVVSSLTSWRPCNSLRKSIDKEALSATSKAAETAPLAARRSAKPSGSSSQSAST